MLKTRKSLTIAAIIIPVCIALVLISSVSFTNYQQRIEQEKETSLLEQANKELGFKNYKKTEALLNEALSHVPDDKEAILLYDKVLRIQGKTEASINLLEANKNIRDARIFNQLAQNYFEQRDYDTALGYADTALSFSNRDSTAFIMKMKVFNLTMAKDTALETIEKVDELYLNKDAKFYRAITLMNFGIDATASLESMALNLPSTYQPLIADYKINYPNTLIPEKTLEAKANLVYALINLNLYELAHPFAQDMAMLNRFYENSLLYRAMINIHIGNLDEVGEDLGMVERYFPHKYIIQLFALQLGIAQGGKSDIDAALVKLMAEYKDENQAQLFEVIKLLYVHGYYEEVYDSITKMGAKLTPYVSETNYLLLKSSVYSNKFSGLQELADQVTIKIADLNHEQKADLYAIKALLASRNNDAAGANAFLQQANELNPFSSFVHFVSWMINKDPIELTRAKELDINNELPSNI